MITQRLPQELREIVGDRRRYLCQGSTGAGNVTPAPWLAVLDPTVTDSPQRGYYVAYLFALDLVRVYATLALGVTEFEQAYGKNHRLLDRLDSAALRLAKELGPKPRFAIGNINLGATRPTSNHGLYEHSSIVALEYDLTDLPPESELRSDLHVLLDYYESLRLKVGPHIDEEAAVEDLDANPMGLIEVVPFDVFKARKSGSGGSPHHARRSRAAKKIGDVGEKRVVEHERQRLADVGRTDLSARVRWLADEGERPGYDVLSFNEDGTQRWIEVKATTGKQLSVVDLTEGERRCAVSAPPGRYWLYVITRVFTRPKQWSKTRSER